MTKADNLRSKIGLNLVQAVIQQFALNVNGTHGISHWARVLENGRKLAPLTGADPTVVELFAILHDAKRIDEGHDDDHGYRSAEYAKTLRGSLLDVTDDQFDLLYQACAHHTDGTTNGDVTIQTCWDADRLDLGRVMIVPNPAFLCTDAAKSPEIRRWANSRSTRYAVPSLVTEEWNVEMSQSGSIRFRGMILPYLLMLRQVFKKSP